MEQLKKKTIGNFVKAVGKSRANQLIAEELGVSINTADKIRRDNYQHKIRPFLRMRLAELLGVTIEELFYE